MQGLHAQRILELRAAKQLRREIWHAREIQLLALGEGIADVDRAVIVQANDVPRIGLLGLAAIGGQEGQRIGNPDILAEAHMAHPHAAGIAAGAQAHEGDAVPVPGVHVGLDLEHEAGQLGLHGADLSLQRGPRLGTGGMLNKGREQFAHAKIVDRGAEEHRGLLRVPVFLQIERRACAAHEFDLLDKGTVALAQELTRRIAV